jgi:hypothetical protein
MPSVLDPNILSSDLKQPALGPSITVNKVMNLIIDNTVQQKALREYTKSIGAAKSLNEFYGLVKTGLDDYQKRANTQGQNLVLYIEDEPDKQSTVETITYSLVRREPGAFSQGAPFEGKVTNLRPVIREIKDDPANPGFRLVTTGYWHDNIVKFTCWARTNKAANARAMWFEAFMDEYSWFFKVQGVDRTLFWGRSEDQVLNVDENKWYGRPLCYYVRTETLRVYSEKTLEDLVINIGFSDQ